MFKFSKRKLTIIITTILISIIILISAGLILIKNFNIQKKQVNSNFVLENKNLAPINTVDAGKMNNSQYISNNWRIKISKIHLDAPIMEGTEQEILRKAVGHFEISSTWNGNVALAAHNRGYKYNYFAEIKKLELGDIIIYQTEYGERKYEVVINEIIKETDLSYIQDTKENKLTLITCEENKREYRRCIQANQI